MEDDIVAKAREFARHAHRDHKRKYTGQPYFSHLEEVATLVERAGLPPKAIAAAWLHDTVEDTDVGLMDLIREFGLPIAALVQYLTDTPPGPGLNRARRKEIDVARLGAADPLAQSIKCADLISNTASIVRYDPGFAKVYLPEKRATLDVLTKAEVGLWAKAEVALLAAQTHLPFAFEERRIEKGLEKFFGGLIHDWPPLPRRRARWWEFSAKRADAKIDAALASVGCGPFTPAMSDRYWKQVSVGQIYDDAGGYIWRCWCAALNLPFLDPEKPYDSKSEALLKSVA